MQDVGSGFMGRSWGSKFISLVLHDICLSYYIPHTEIPQTHTFCWAGFWLIGFIFQQVEQLFQLLHSVVADTGDGPPTPSPDFDLEDFAEEQNLVARLVHLLHSPQPEVQFEV